MKTILAGTDFTSSSLNACRYAALLAQKSNCKLTVFNLFLAPVLHSNSGLYGISYASVKKTSETRISKLIEKLLAEFPGLKINALATSGAFEDELAAFLGRHKIECVVMGLESKSRISKFIWGSHGVKIAGKIETPVIIVPEKYRVHKINTILLAVDNAEKLHTTSLKNVEKFAEACKSVIKPLHIRTPDEVIVAAKNSWLKLNGEKKEVEVFKSNNIESGLKKYCLAEKTDLVAVISKKHSVVYNLFNESVTKRVAFAARVPVMAIHE
ncbi:MAG TPA: universal stress protein [Bacteroidia bacterium]|nr:universal stress protein [Bacteroidia bacterium]